MAQSARAQIVERRTYLRPLDKNGKEFETPDQAWRRVIDHQRWLWERARGSELEEEQEAELEELYNLFINREATVSGRTRWLGGTEVAKRREASQFNCSFGEIQTVHDVVDSIWLLLQGCGVGFRANIGVLNGFTSPLELVIIRSRKELPKDANGQPLSDESTKGNPNNIETFDKKSGVWTIVVGDSAEAWAKLFGKILAFKKSARTLVVDLSEIRPAGYRLSGYGWISSGDSQIAKAIAGIVGLMNKRSGKLLTAMDILDIENHLGTILSSRRSAEIALYPFGEPEWKEFANAKKDHYLSEDTKHRAMSNNSLLFYHKPKKSELTNIFAMMKEAGGSEPGFINAIAALKRAPHFKGVNPCAEILLGDKSFCNLVEVAVSRFNGRREELHRALYLVARANYRQTCVNLDDGVLQRTWHELNEFLRLCGVGLTGIIGWEGHKNPEELEALRTAAHAGCNGMADELGLPRAKLITTVKPSGTQSKVFGLVGDEVSEGAHKPLAKYIFNRIRFPAADPMLHAIEKAGYKVEDDPYSESDRLVVVPVEYPNVEFGEESVGGVVMEVNTESAVDQLNRYKLLQENYTDHNTSITIYYDDSEVSDIVSWLFDNWDSYIGVSFLYRTDPTKTAEDLGFPYLPQQPVDENTFREYADSLDDIDFSGTDSEEMLDMDDCATGACPVR